MTSIQTVGYHKFIETASEFKWTLYNFSTFNQPTGNFISSQIFLCNGLRWRIDLYPNGYNKDCAGNISIILSHLTNLQITVECEITVSNNTSVYETRKFKSTYLFDNLSNYGFFKFLKRDALLDFLKKGNDILTIVFKFVFSNLPQETNSHLDLIKDVGLLRSMKENYDVILVSSDGSKHKAHKAILVCRSRVFSAFQHNMKESQDNVVKIDDVDDETLRRILHFMYTGELVAIMKDAKKLFIAADKYELIVLKTMCINYLCENIKVDNALDLIQFADTYNVSELKVKAKEYFVQNRKEILSIERRENLKDLPRDIIENLLCDLAYV